jgi:hypothetical protein
MPPINNQTQPNKLIANAKLSFTASAPSQIQSGPESLYVGFDEDSVVITREVSRACESTNIILNNKRATRASSKLNQPLR